MRTLFHPARDQITLPAVLDALSDPTRLAIAVQVAERGEVVCRDLAEWGSKTNLSYHFAKLREAGILRTRIEGVFRRITVRWDDLEARFPGLVRQLLATAKREKVGITLPEHMEEAPRRRKAKRRAA